MRQFVLLALVSCGQSNIRWSLPPSFTDAQRAQFVSACGTWNAVANVQQSIGEGDRHVVIRDRSEMQNGCAASGETNGTEMRLAPDADEAAMAHELGHTLGLGHHAGPGVMANGATTARLNAADIEECERVGACE